MRKFTILFIAAFMAFAYNGWGQIISQYIETNSGSAPKGIEIWNTTADVLDFSVNNLVIEKGTNGATPSPDYTLSTGTLAVGDVLVIGTPDMETTTVANGSDFYEKAFTFNGDDALVVKYGGTITDVFGEPGVDPGSAWTGNGVSTANQNIQLKAGITTGDVVGWSDPSIRFETVSMDPSGDGPIGFGIAPILGGNLLPEISNVVYAPFTVTSSTLVSVSADVTDPDGTIDLVELNWGTAPGILTNNINMSLIGGDTYTTDSYIPVQANGTTVYYQVYAEDDIGDDNSSSEMSYTVFDPASTTLPYNEPFDLDLGNCNTFSTSGPLEYWQYASYGGNGYAEMNGYNTGDVEEDWLIFPAINFDNYSNERMSFDSWYQYATDDADNYLKLYYSTTYIGVGDPTAVTDWTEIGFTQPGAENSWTSSGVLDISGISGTNVYIALKYRYEAGNYRWWQVDNIAIYEASFVDVTFQVNMEEQVVSPNGVHVTGSFNGWSPSATEMFDGDADGTYDVTISLISDIEYQFKYINGDAWGTSGIAQEIVPGACGVDDGSGGFNRTVTASGTTTLDVVCYGSCFDCGYVPPTYDVTFQVDMQNQTVTGDVNIAGNFNGWNSTSTPMTNVCGNIWEYTQTFDEGSYLEYKFINSGAWESIGNRTYTTPSNDVTLDLVCFDSYEACPAVDFVMINEVDADTPGSDVAEFIELYDGGIGCTPLHGLVVVLYNGSDDASYEPAFDLDGYFTNVDGYFTIGSTGMGTDIEYGTGWLQNGPDAVSLYTGDDTDFPNDTPVTDVNLIDAIVYGTNDPDDPALIDVLTPGQPQVNEAGRGSSADNSNQRIPNGSGGMRVTMTYDQSTPTTGVENVSVYTDWTGAVDSNWDDAGNWTNGIPTAGLNASIPDVATKAPFPVISNPGAVTNQLYIATNAELYINVNGDLTTNGTFTNSGTFTIMNDGTANVGSFIDNGGISGGGTFDFYREMMGTSATGADHGWHFISPPTDGLTSDQLLPDYYLNWWNEGGDTWVHVEGGDCSNPAIYPFENGVGYSVLRDLDYTCPNPVGNNLNFGGPFYNMHNSGDTYAPTYTVDGTFEGGGWNLFGNPYPSPVDINTMVNDAGFPTSLNGAVHIWDDVSTDYIESAGGVGEVQQVPATQGFFMQATAGGTLTFDNAWRTHDGSDNFYKDAITDVLELSVAGNGYSDNIFIRFFDEATSGFDRLYDAHKLISSGEFVPQIYTTNGINKFAINALPATTIVPMGFTCVTSGEYTISAIETSEFANVVLEDLTTGEQTDLLTSSYTFNYTVNDDADRFFVHFTPLGIGDNVAGSIDIWSNDHKIYVQTPEINGDIVVFNLMGQEVIRTQIKSGLNVIPVSDANAFYVVKIVGSEASKTGKVYVR